MTNRRRVVIVGGGVAGLTAAHELVERDFEVVVYERRLTCGGKASSSRVDLPNLKGLPGEHGFRFFPGWYKHLPHTLGRIPSDKHRGHKGENTVLDHLVDVSSNLLASYTREPIPIVLHAPRTAQQAQKLLSFVMQMQKLGLSVEQAVQFMARLMEFLSVPDDLRRLKYDDIPWATFVGVDSRSAAFKLLASHTRSLVAAKATESSAYTIATMAVRTLLQSSLTIDRVLDGPTSEVWITPWERYLRGQGVQFVKGYELDSVHFDGRSPLIQSLRFKCIDGRHFKHADETNSFPESAEWGRLRGAAAASDHAGRMKQARSHRGFVEEKADYYVFAIPVEQMAYYINRSTMMTHHDPELRDIIRLSGSIDWMAGIQFYFSTPINLEPGHIVCSDTEWALTAIDQSQFWRDANVPREVQSILSVDISAWDEKGRFNSKEAFRCTNREIAEEVWQQLEASLNRRAGQAVLGRAMLINGELDGSYHLDDNVAERYDRKRQARYSLLYAADRRAQAVRYGADELLGQQMPLEDVPFIFGSRLELNVEPILVNRPGTLRLRPHAAREKIPNMFLAADYVDTATNLACMEGANEASRRAVNAILEQSGSRHEPCQTWEFADRDVLSTAASMLRLVQQGPGVGNALEVATSAASTLTSAATRTLQSIRKGWQR